jgi:hypothetical protein
MELIAGWLSTKIAAYVGGSIAAFFIAWVLKKIPNEKIKMAVGELMYDFGVVITLGLSKWKWTSGYWNKLVEPYFVDLIDNIVGEGVKQFIKGLRSDNKA